MIDKKQAAQKGIKILDSTKDSNPLEEMLKTHFPQSIKEGQANLNAIAALLGKDISNAQGYELTFTGKGLANALYSTPTQKMLKFEETFCHSKHQSHEVQTSKSVVGVEGEFEREEGATSPFKPLRPLIKEDSNNREISAFQYDKNGNATQNFIIKGDNLDVLKILKSAYTEKIKMIYIDPPYNTKNENFIYPDNFRKDYKAILQEVGLIEIDENGQELESETLQFFRNIQGSRTHSGWLSFMLPRLKLARDLLREDGVIFISIDDNEQANLKLLCDEIFGEENFVETFLWNKTQTPPSASNKTRKTHEFILCYQKEKDNQKMIARISEGGDAPLWNETNSERILTFPANYVYSNLENGVYKKGIRDKIELLDNVKVENGRIVNSFRLKGHFRWKQETLDLEILQNVFLIVKSDKFSIRYCRQEERIVMPTNEISKRDGVGTNETASSELSEIMGDKIFNFNKPVSLCKYLISLVSNKQSSNNLDKKDIILDFFAGSGTTAQAVMELNAEDGGNRRFILVQIDEPILEDKSKVAYDFCKNELKSKNPVISDITIERVKRVSEKIAKHYEDSKNPKGENLGFSVLALSDKPELITTEKGTLKLLSNKDLSPLDKAINLALQSGKTLDKPLKTIFENKLYQCEDCFYLISCDKEVLEFLRGTQNEYIFIDGFEELDLESFLNLDSSLNDRLRVVY
ncbi:site-specific DNA-methyltransferase [Campylobacter sp. MIT 21-1685]|uniref:site-specific DNA-methyltransferase n=1 Tax=unclassified Campylobacter TaxID=2593542 RepID=UPI00224B3EB2|nr:MULTISPECIES: site-specific DNA-methyltransferase [unclassified Campylobacter]MCX2683445.1 site-specific DNA-methyltransferase [Campylobacter sp. MIT 21-1684]MCX2751733.1 site-specific DNA-methyltransferase [Campylobacter sp. MIT 21-1682]MCX2807935.1 site-specific DNA-methyltransferase [Campylobacter sp. MIT 21-1685]